MIPFSAWKYCDENRMYEIEGFEVAASSHNPSQGRCDIFSVAYELPYNFVKFLNEIL